ncbi:MULTISPECIES: GerW family sporulation protein [Paenibacillus]|uniref:GerW family sporulation protein n=2 Tax=Paenibacillus TaxID=44249 RepID=A0A383RCM0_PAEAL|nr:MULTISPECIES: GerW family sporulation protein [Paenibacillus]MCM3289723.1 GerW family sporulation protein [Paenibacillus sp. MER 180]MCY9530473.1 GerW family sporulation protein [Paenibacillus alvei]TQR46914.1 sporulation protein YtfJ [Paenibacillus sp. SDF0028]SYX84720.1 germination-associated protein [Paenibacillus alvei]
MAEHPIEGLMHAAFNNIKAMVDVNAIVGDPVQTPDGSVILPISRVAFGFAAGGSDFRLDERHDRHDRPASERGEARTVPAAYAYGSKPFGGGSGGGVYITPIAFLVVGRRGIDVVSLDNQTHLLEKIIDAAPNVLDQISSMFKKQESTTAEDIIISDR